MSVWARAAREGRFLAGLMRTLRRVSSVAPDSAALVCDDIEEAVDRFGPNLAIVDEQARATYVELDARANRYAHWASGLGLQAGDIVALIMLNRLDYIACWVGLSKVGISTALINTNLTGSALAHCLSISQAKLVITDTDTTAALAGVRPQVTRSAMPEWRLGERAPSGEAGAQDLDAGLANAADTRPDRAIRAELRARDLALLIFTSGTTGLPKAARITHARAQLYMRGFAGATGATSRDRVLNVLPLYHATGGLCGVGAAMLNGGAVVLRRKFSASRFWEDVRAEQATMAVYIGELCRYLINAPETAGEGSHGLKLMFGNGLRPDVWERLQARFHVPRILEFYGSTEGNVSMFNFDGRPGAVGRIPAYLRKTFNVRLVRFDVEAEIPVRGADGFCIECAVDEAGEALGEIGGDARSSYTGYADEAASENKILRDVFKPGDAWFRTGDLMRQDAEGYFYFVDRIGDTFRWRGENVSTGEVAERLGEIPGVQEANVYGVAIPGTEGRAGMAALVTGPGFDLTSFQRSVEASLAPYAQPLFLRLLPTFETTGTFKYRKLDLVRDGFDPARVSEPLYFKLPGAGYAPIGEALHAEILSGAFKL